MTAVLARVGRLAGLFGLLAIFIHARAFSSNETSRLAAIEAYVHRGTWAITQSPFRTVDRIQVGAEFYSDKPPLMAALGVLVYAPLRQLTGWSLQAHGCDAAQAPAHCRALWLWPEADWAYVTLTALIVTLPAAVILEVIYTFARRVGWGVGAALAFVVVLGFGTALWPYSLVFANHVPAALLVFGAVFVLQTRPPQSRWGWLAGGLAMLSVAFDLSAGIFFMALGGWVWLQTKSARALLGFVGGGVAPLLMFIGLNTQITGGGWPPYMYAQGYEYAGSELWGQVAGTRAAANIGQYTFDLLLGERGFLMFYPIVAWYLWATARALLAKDRLAWALALGTLGYGAYFALFTDNFGGYAYSPRWLLIPIPLLALFALKYPLKMPSRWAWAVAAGLAAISGVSAYWGALNPWQPARPLWRLAYTAPAPDEALAVSISGYSNFYAIPESLRLGITANNVRARAFEAQRGIVIPPGLAWWFIRAHTPPTPALAAVVNLTAETEQALYANLRPAAERWLQEANQTVATPPATLPLTLGGEMTLLGWQQQPAPDGLQLVTLWQIEHDSLEMRSVFAHLVDAANRTVRQDDAWAAEPATLRAGDWVLLAQAVGWADLPAASYEFQLGVYNPRTGARLATPDGWEMLTLEPTRKQP